MHIQASALGFQKSAFIQPSQVFLLHWLQLALDVLVHVPNVLQLLAQALNLLNRKLEVIAG